jgi:hypothetical protein
VPPLTPLFSIIVVHFQGAVPHEIFLRGVASLQAQTFRDYEILVYHDGPLLDVGVQSPVPIRTTERRFNDWGHSLRDLGIREAAGEYIVHFNADNVLYPEALQEIANEIARPPRMFGAGPERKPIDANDVIIFPIKMFGLQRVWQYLVQFKADASRNVPQPSWFEILTGNPPVKQNIDAMQLVMRRTLWLAEGGWSDKSEWSDGVLYARFAEKYGYRTVGPVLGEHH